jgi:hypothetical protein
MDIVERLRTEQPSYVLIGDAAIEIERLREQAHYHYENGLKKDVETERLRNEVTWYYPDALRWDAPHVKDDQRVSAIIKVALKEGE